MTRNRIAVDRQLKAPRHAESGGNVQARAAEGQILNRAGKLLTGSTELDDTAFVRGLPGIFSSVEHVRPIPPSARNYALWATSLGCATASGLPGNMYVRVRLQL